MKVELEKGNVIQKNVTVKVTIDKADIPPVTVDSHLLVLDISTEDKRNVTGLVRRKMSKKRKRDSGQESGTTDLIPPKLNPRDLIPPKLWVIKIQGPIEIRAS